MNPARFPKLKYPPGTLQRLLNVVTDVRAGPAVLRNTTCGPEDQHDPQSPLLTVLAHDHHRVHTSLPSSHALRILLPFSVSFVCGEPKEYTQF